MTDRHSKDLVCRELVELVTEYLSEALTADDRARFEHHLSECPPCTTYLAQMRATIALAGTLSSSASTGAQPELLRVFRSWSKSKL
jgi:anti-sigma factor RsiW